MAKKWTAFRRGLTEPLAWMYRDGQRAVFHKIDIVELITTPDGEMVAVRFRNKVDLANPDTDIAALVGQAKKVRKSGAVDPQSPELWYWNDKFWLKAVDSAGNDYYNKKCYLIYEVTVENGNALLGGLKHHWQNVPEDEQSS